MECVRETNKERAKTSFPSANTHFVKGDLHEWGEGGTSFASERLALGEFLDLAHRFAHRPHQHQHLTARGSVTYAAIQPTTARL